MAGLPDNSVDMILCDLPYGTTACKWDTVIPFEPLWAQYRRIAKRNAAIVLTASQPFTTALIASNMREFKYELIWDKGRGFEPQLANIRPMKAHENVLVFCRMKTPYNAQMVPCEPYTMRRKSLNKEGGQNILSGGVPQTKTYTAKCPTSIVRAGFERGLHPTQKPVALMEYLIRTYTHEGDVVLDNCAGSGTTGVACANTGRRFIGIERDDKYFAIASERIAAAQRAAA
jgi:site-specific DNA-methyltransferase (adenine-specific)